MDVIILQNNNFQSSTSRNVDLLSRYFHACQNPRMLHVRMRVFIALPAISSVIFLKLAFSHLDCAKILIYGDRKFKEKINRELLFLFDLTITS